MKKLALIIVVLFICIIATQAQEGFRKNPPVAGPAPKIELGTYQEFTLANGLRGIVVENHKLPQVSFQLFVDVPPFKEGEYAGTASLAGQLLRNGTKTKTKAQIDQAVDFIGAALSTSSSGASGSSLTKHREKLFALMADVVLNPTFPAAEFDKLKKQTESSLSLSKDDPNSIASNVAQVLRYGKNHPYGEPVTEQTVENITLERVKNYYQTYFKPNISYLIVVGDIKSAEAKVLAEKYFGKWVKGEVKRTPVPVVAKPDSTQVAFVHRPGAVQSVVTITYPVELKPGSPNAIKARLANTILGAPTFGSRLFKNIREDKGYSYGAYTSLSADEHVGSFSAGAAVRNEVTDSTITQFLYEMNRMWEAKVAPDELSYFKNFLTGSFARSLEQPGTIAQFALNTARYKLPKDYYNTYLQKLSAVTAEEVQEMAKTYFTPSKAHILVVGDKNTVADKLATFDADGEITYYDNYGSKIKMISATAAADMTAEKVIHQYVEAIGGKENIQLVNDVTMKLATSVQGANLEIVYRKKAPNKLHATTSVNGMVMSEQKFDGSNGTASQMGQKEKLEGEALEALKNQALMFPESKYLEMGYKLTLKGIEQVEGKNAYQIEVTTPGGGKLTEFYDVETGLKIRMIQALGDDSSTLVTDFDNYKTVNGVKFPYTLTLTGVAPFPIKSTVSSIEVNKGIEDAVFTVE